MRQEIKASTIDSLRILNRLFGIECIGTKINMMIDLEKLYECSIETGSGYF